MRLTTEKSKKQKIYQILEDEILNKGSLPARDWLPVGIWRYALDAVTL